MWAYVNFSIKKKIYKRVAWLELGSNKIILNDMKDEAISNKDLRNKILIVKHSSSNRSPYFVVVL